MQKREGVERPIAFFSRIIRDGALKYNIIEKQALALVKALKDFRVYILHSHIIAYVPSAAIKDVLVQADPEGRQGKWITALLEYDVEIKPTKLIKGQGLAKLRVIHLERPWWNVIELFGRRGSSKSCGGLS